MNFERIDGDHERAKVFGGWIVKTHTEAVHIMPNGDMEGGWEVAMTFVPDPNHEWQLEDKQ